MVESIETGNTKQRLLEGRPAPKAPRKSADVFVANTGEKRYLWTARAFAVITAISLCCNLVLIFAIFQIIPLFRIEPFLLTFQNKQEQVYNISPVGTNVANQKAISEVFVRQYVLLRSTFDNDLAEMEARWGSDGPIREMSNNVVYSDFIDQTATRALELIRTDTLVRNIKILTVNELGSGLWQVEYETQDMYPASHTPEINYWTASLRITYRRKSVKYGDRLKNPIGFTVIGYSLRHNKVS